VKQFVPEEWSSPPLEAKLVPMEGLGTVCMGRGAVNQKGPENSFLSALMAFKAAGKKLPVNLVLVCEGEEEIGSPHFGEVVRSPEVLAELKKCIGVFMPEAGQQRDGTVEVSLGAKGVVELELISSGEKWGRGPKHDVHSSLEAAVDSPTWHLVQAIITAERQRSINRKAPWFLCDASVTEGVRHRLLPRWVWMIVFVHSSQNDFFRAKGSVWV